MYKHIINNIKRKKYIIPVSACFLFLLGACLVQILLPNKVITYELNTDLDSNDIGNEVELLENISLPIGSWRCDLSCKADSDLGTEIRIKDTKGVSVSNGTVTYEGLPEIGFDVNVYYPADNLCLIARHSDGKLSIQKVVFRETNLLWCKYIFVLMIGLLLLHGISVYNFLYSEGLINRENWKDFYLVNLLCIAASIVFFNNQIFTGADLGYHILRVEGIKESILSGIFPTRIEPQWVQGYGYADAIYCCPLFLYIPAVLRIAGFNISEAINIYNICVNFATGWIAYYCFKQVFNNNRVGIICSAISLFSLYRICAFYFIGMTGVGTSITFLPLVLLGLWRLFFEPVDKEGFKSDIKSFLPLALGMAGIVQSHVLTSEITLFICVVTGVVFLIRIIKNRSILGIIKAALFSIALCLWYLVPFADYYFTQDMYINHSGTRNIQQFGLPFSSHFVMFPDTDAAVSGYYGVGIVMIIFLLAFIYVWVKKKMAGKKDGLTQLAGYSFVFSIVLIIFTLKFFPWDGIQGLSPLLTDLIGNLEFPSRFLGWIYTFLCVVVGYVYLYFSGGDNKIGKIITSSLIILFLIGTSIFLLDHNKTVQNDTLIVNPEAIGNGYTPGNFFLPYNTKPEDNRYGVFKNSDNVKIIEKNKGNLRASVICNNSGDEDGWVEIPLHMFKGYRAYSEMGELKTEYGKNNVVRVVVPKGFEGKIKVLFKSPWYWRVAEIISFIAYCLLIVLSIRFILERRKKEEKN